MSVSHDFVKQVNGYGLTTAHIFYRRPDKLWLVQEYVWQDYDLLPRLPRLSDFLEFWDRELEGPLIGVQVAHSGLIRPAEFRIAKSVTTLH